MAMLPSPAIVTNGLVFYYDMNNQKSYTGPSIRNFIGGLSPIGQTGTGIVVTTGSETVNIPSVGEITTQFVNLQNTGASACCVAFMNFGNAGNIFTGSTLYTYLILYRSDSGYTNSNWMYRYEYNSSGTYQTESGVHTTGNRTYLGNGWYYAWGTFTTQAATTQLQCYAFSYNYSSFNDKISFAKACILQGNYSGLHPRYWPEPNTTRSNTQSIYDLTGNRSITASSVTYNSDGTFKFVNTSSNRLEVSSSTYSFSGGTLEAWIKLETKNINQGFVGLNNVGYVNFWMPGSSNQMRWEVIGNTGLSYSVIYSNTVFTTGVWYHVTGTFDGTNTKIYVNGKEENTQVMSNQPSSITGTMYIGDYNAGGYPSSSYISSVKLYNRSLSASEILQNFNAQRGLYGV